MEALRQSGRNAALRDQEHLQSAAHFRSEIARLTQLRRQRHVACLRHVGCGGAVAHMNGSRVDSRRNTLAFVPLSSIPALVLLAVAIVTVHLPYGFSSIHLLSVANGRAQLGPPGYECDLLYIAGILALALSDPTWSVDRYRSSKRGIEFD